MLNQKRSGNLARLKYLAALPVCASLLCASTLGFSKTYGVIDIAPQEQTDTITKLKLAEIKQPLETPEKIRKDINQTLKIEPFEQKKTALKPAQSPDKLTVVELAPAKDTGKSADLIKKLPGIKVASNGDIYAQGKPVTKVRVNGKDVKGDVIEKEAPTVLQLQKVPPPMEPIPPVSKGFDNLFKSIAEKVKYPKAARAAGIVGNVVLRFDWDGDKIDDIMVNKGIGSGCDEEVIRVLHAFKGSLTAWPGNYKLAVTFNLDGIEPPKSASPDFAKDPSFAGEITVTGYPVKK